MNQNNYQEKKNTQLWITLLGSFGIILIIGMGIFSGIIGVKNKGIRYEESLSEDLANMMRFNPIINTRVKHLLKL